MIADAEPTDTLTPAELEQRRQAARTHGQTSAFAVTHDQSDLLPEQRSAWAEIRADLETRDGRWRVMADLTADGVLLAKWGDAWAKAKAETDGPVSAFESPMMTRHISVRNSARQHIEALHKLSTDDDGGDVTRILEQLKK